MSSAVANLNSIMLCLFLLCVLVQNDSEQITQAFEEDKVVKQHLLRPKTAEHARAGSKTPFHEYYGEFAPSALESIHRDLCRLHQVEPLDERPKHHFDQQR